MKPNVKPLDFARLKKLSQRGLQINQALLARFPQVADEDFAQVLLQQLGQLLNKPLNCQYQSMEETSYEKFIHHFATPSLGVVLEAQPQNQQIILDMDYALAQSIVQHALGNANTQLAHPTTMSAVEEGIFEFLLTQILHCLKTQSSLFGPCTLRLQKIVHESKLLNDSTREEELGCVFKFFLGFGSQGGYVNIYFPHPLIEGLIVTEDPMTGWMSPEEESLLEQRMARASHVKASLQSEIGTVQLSPSEKEQIEVGDVILFDQTLASLTAHGVSGKTILRTGHACNHGLLADVVDSEGKLVVKILDFYGDDS